MKVVDQESITQRNSKPISREIQSQSAKKFRAIGTNIQSQLKKKRKKRKKKKEKKKNSDNIKCCRIPIEGCNPRKILKWTKKSNADLMTSLTEENSAKQYQ